MNDIYFTTFKLKRILYTTKAPIVINKNMHKSISIPQ